MTTERANHGANGRRRIVLVAVAALIAIVVAVAALYRAGTEFVIGRDQQQSAVPAVAGAVPSEAFNFSFFNPPRPLPALHFVDGEGRSLTLADFRGRPIVLNIWATWCIPCRKEMPALDRLQAAFDKSELLVVPLSIDHQGLPVVEAFYRNIGLKTLGLYLDRPGKAASELHTVGVPTTLIIDRQGREIGRKVGPAEWDSADTIALLRDHLGLLAGGPQKAAK